MNPYLRLLHSFLWHCIRSLRQWRRLILTVLLLVGCSIIYHYRDYLLMKHDFFLRLDGNFMLNAKTRDFSLSDKIVYRSQCKCRQDLVELRQSSQHEYVVSVSRNSVDNSSMRSKNTTSRYSLNAKDLKSSVFTCNMYNTLRRGPNLKVISYSLYGTTPLYYKYIKSLVKRISDYYPGWIVRILHDNSIDPAVICEIECLKRGHESEESTKTTTTTTTTTKTGTEPTDDTYYDIVDFCNVEELPHDLKLTWNASYMHGMTWRWLPIGDTFIDYVASRDTDAWISRRELDSVNVWMNSNRIFHVMRDVPVHDIPIVGGYWGFANVRDRPLALHLFKILTNARIAYFYNKVKNRKGDDQFLLTEYFSFYSARNSTTHDSYSCDRFGGEAWPTQRPNGWCFVGCTGCCDQLVNDTSTFPFVCPTFCRPPDHQDWIYC